MAKSYSYPKASERETLIVSEGTRRSMQGNRGKDSKLEVGFRKALWAAGLRGYRTNVGKLPGKPDVVFGRARLAVFVHGCYWHGCEACGRFTWPKLNAAYWRAKIEANKARDVEVRARLEALGYTAVTIWECEAKQDIDACVERVRLALDCAIL